MRTKRILLALSISSFLAIAAACGGDDSNGGQADGGSSDGSVVDATGGDSGGGSDSSVPLDAKANDLDVYVQQTATLDATASTPSTAAFSWQLASAPAGSNITNASIANATTPTPSFVPDTLGTYVFTLKVTSDGATATKNVNVRAFAGKAFISHYVNTDAGVQSDVLYAPTFGGDGGTSTVSCETLYVGKFSSTDGTLQAPFAQETLPGSIDWREGLPGSEAIVAFGFRETASDGGFTNYLASGTSSSTCGTLLKLDALVNAGDVPTAVRISPNADRAAFIRQNGSSIDVATIGLDGSNLRVLGSVYRSTDGGAGTLPTTTGYSFLKRRVQWIDETHVAWIGIDTDVPGAFNVLTATDSTTPNVTDYMDCTAPVASGTTSVNEPDILEFAMLGDGSVLVSGEVSTVDAGAQGIYALRPNAGTRQCELQGQIGVQGQNFAISPEGSRIAFTGQNVDAGTTEMFVAPLAGGSPSLVRSNDAGLSFFAGFGPQWVQGGAALLYTGGPTIIDGGSTTNALVVPASGGAISPIGFSANSSDTYLVPTNDAACSIGFAGSATPLVGIFFSLGLLVARRRRKNAKQD